MTHEVRGHGRHALSLPKQTNKNQIYAKYRATDTVIHRGTPTHDLTTAHAPLLAETVYIPKCACTNVLTDVLVDVALLVLVVVEVLADVTTV